MKEYRSLPFQTHETQQRQIDIQDPSRRTSTSEGQGKTRPGESSSVGNTQEHERDQMNTKKHLTTSSFSGDDEHSRTSSPESNGLGRREPSPNRSRARQMSARFRQKPNVDPSSSLKGKSGRGIGRNESSTIGKAESRQRRGQSETDADRDRKSRTERRRKSDENSDGGGSRSSSASSSREPEFNVPVQTKATHNDYHLKYTDNDVIRQWLQSKNSHHRRQIRKQRRLERSRRQQLQEEQEAKEERRKKSEILVQRWMEEKNVDRMLNKRQQQNPKTLEHTQQGGKPAEDQGGKKHESVNHPGNSAGKKDLSLLPANHQDRRNTYVVTEDKSPIPLLIRLDKNATVQRATARKTSGLRMSGTESRRNFHYDWATGNRNARLSTSDQGKSEIVEDERKDVTGSSSAQRIPHLPPAQGLEKPRRSASARVKRRRAGDGSSRLQGSRPVSSKPGRIRTRLEPQGADRLDPVSEPDGGSAASKSKQEDEENANPDGAKVTDVATAKKDDSCSHTFPNTSHELEGGKKTSSDPNDIQEQNRDLEKVSEDENSTSKDHPRLSPTMRSSRDLQLIIKSATTDSENQNSRSNSNPDDRHFPTATRENAEDKEQTEEGREKEATEERHSREGEEETTDMAKTSDTESYRNSDGDSNNIAAAADAAAGGDGDKQEEDDDDDF